MERSIRSRFGSYAKSSESLNRVPRADSPRTDFHPTVGFAPRRQGRLGGGHRPLKQSGGVAESRREPPCAAARALGSGCIVVAWPLRLKGQEEPGEAWLRG